jgi:hypothetical protein
MAAQSIVCGTCAAAVPYGRLSCPSCGELLASVSGSRQASAAVVATVPDVLYAAEAGPTAAVVDGQLSLESVGRDLEAELPWSTAAVDVGAADSDVAAFAGPIDDGGLGGLATDAAFDDAEDPSASTDGPSWALSGTSLGGSPTPSYMPRPGLGPNPVPAAAFAGPGAYVPPLPVAVVPAGPAAPARAWGGYPPDAAAPAEPARAAPSTDPAAAADRRARFAEFVGWLSVAGAAFAAVGFLLPWGMVMVGSSGVGYFDRWGLAGPAHLLIVAGLLAILALSFVTNPVPVWIRTGLAGLGLGALLFGIVWPYLIGPLGSGPGVLIVAVGAVALAVAGILALVADRHAGAGPSV